MNSLFVSVDTGGYSFNAQASCPENAPRGSSINVDGQCVQYTNMDNAPPFFISPNDQNRQPVLFDEQRYGTFTPVNPF